MSNEFRYYEGFIERLPKNGVFVFGSNQAGRHGMGAALTAFKRFGARRGRGEGRMGNAYAIPTKDHTLKPRSLYDVEQSIQQFLFYAAMEPDTDFYVTEVGCGLAGFTIEEIAPLFQSATNNCIFPISFKPYLEESDLE